MKSRVLVVEIDPGPSEALTDALRLERYLVQCADTLERALALLHEELWDLVLTDSLTPVWDGSAMEPVHLLVQAAQGTPVVLLTAQAATLNPAQEGIVAVIVKPFGLAALLAVVGRWLLAFPNAPSPRPPYPRPHPLPKSQRAMDRRSPRN